MFQKIYTKKGDTGKTSLLDGVKIGKESPVLEVLGSLDMLNAQIGYLCALLKKSEVHPLDWLQEHLFSCGAIVAGMKEESDIDEYPLDKDEVDLLEEAIDEMTKELPRLKNFILPGGSEEVAWTHVVRATTRQAERNLCKLEYPNPRILVFLNRLSDYFFTLARFINYKAGKEDITWKMEE